MNLSFPTVNTQPGSVDPCLCLRENNALLLNYSDRPALFTHEEEEEGEGKRRDGCGKGGRGGQCTRVREDREEKESEGTTIGGHGGPWENKWGHDCVCG